MEGIAHIVFLSFYIPVMCVNFLHCVFVIGETSRTRRKNSQKKEGKEEAAGTRKRLSTALRTEGGNVMHPIVFYLPGKRSCR